MSAIAAHSNKASGAGFFAMPSLAPNVISRRLSKYISHNLVTAFCALLDNTASLIPDCFNSLSISIIPSYAFVLSLQCS